MFQPRRLTTAASMPPLSSDAPSEANTSPLALCCLLPSAASFENSQCQLNAWNALRHFLSVCSSSSTLWHSTWAPLDMTQHRRQHPVDTVVNSLLWPPPLDAPQNYWWHLSTPKTFGCSSPVCCFSQYLWKYCSRSGLVKGDIGGAGGLNGWQLYLFVHTRQMSQSCGGKRHWPTALSKTCASYTHLYTGL